MPRRATTEIRSHRNYNARDYAYLAAKGWTDEEIVARWDVEPSRCEWRTTGAKAKLASALRAAKSQRAERHLRAYAHTRSLH